MKIVIRVALLASAVVLFAAVPRAEFVYKLHAGTESDLVFRSIGPNSRAGMTVAQAGDVNDDGIPDVIIGAPSLNEVYIVLGRQHQPGVLRLEPITDGIVVIKSDLPGFDFGWAVAAAGDFNGDFVDDVIIGWPGAEGVNPDSGAAVVIWGDPTLQNNAPGVAVDLSTLIGVQGFIIQGLDPGDRTGAAVAGRGDLNDDGMSDVVVASPGARFGANRGKFHVLYGFIDPPAVLPIAPLGALGIEILTSVDGGMSLGTSTTLCAMPGDVNGDNIDDLLLGTPLYSPPPYDRTGAAWLILGMGQTGPPLISLDEVGAATSGTRFMVDPSFLDIAETGTSVAGVGDVDGDGRADIAIGVPGERQLGTGGMVAVYFGTDAIQPTVDLYSSLRVTRIIDDTFPPASRFGTSVAPAGDPNNDGVPDLVAGAPMSRVGAIGVWPAGQAYVIYGRGAPVDLFLSTADRNAVRLFGVFGERTSGELGDLFGWSVCGPGDLNGDGVDDISVGAPFVRSRFSATATVGMVFNFFFEPPRILAVYHDDNNGNDMADPGEVLHLAMNMPVEVVPGPVEDMFFVGNIGQMDPGSILDQRRLRSRRAHIRLGPAVTDLFIPGLQSALDFSEFGMPGRVVSRRLGVNAIDTGQPRLNDTAVDIRRRLQQTVGTIQGPLGGSVVVPPGPDSFYSGHGIRFAPNALSANAQVELTEVPDTPGDFGLGPSVRVFVSEPFNEAVLTIKFRNEDIPPYMTKRHMRIAQIVAHPDGTFDLQVLPGPQYVNVADNTVTTTIGALPPPPVPRKTQGGTGLYAGLPIDTVDENRSGMVPKIEATPVAIARTGLAKRPGKMATVTLQAGPIGIYTQHQIVFHDFETSSPGEVEVTIRTATLAERTYMYPVIDSQYFPDHSDAVFTVEVTDQWLSPIEFASSVDLNIQYMPSGNPMGYSDILDFDGNDGSAIDLRIVRSIQDPVTYVPDFELVSGSQTVNQVNSTVELTSFTGLTDTQGRATYGVVAIAAGSTRSRHWSLYK